MNAANCCVIRDQISLCDEVAELAAENAPRRFALCWLDEDEQDGGVCLWGMELPFDRAIVVGEDGHPLGVFSSAEAARKSFGRGRELVLIWLDEPATSGWQP
jgi:hypothetical protein